MMMIQRYFNGNVRTQIKRRAEQLGLKGQEAIEVINTAKITVREVLQAELKNGGYNEVVFFLKAASVKAARNLIFDKIIQRVVARLIVRFGLPHTLALTLATMLVPFILKRLGRKALNSGKVQDLLHVLGVTDRVEKLSILKHQIQDKFKVAA